MPRTDRLHLVNAMLGQFITGFAGRSFVARITAVPVDTEGLEAWIIEDDYETEFRYERRPVEAIQGLDRRGRVIYAARWVADRQPSTFSRKWWSPASSATETSSGTCAVPADSD